MSKVVKGRADLLGLPLSGPRRQTRCHWVLDVGSRYGFMGGMLTPQLSNWPDTSRLRGRSSSNWHAGRQSDKWVPGNFDLATLKNAEN